LSAEQSDEMMEGSYNEAQEPEPEEPTFDEAEAIDHGEIFQEFGVTLSDLADDESDRSSVELEDMVAEVLINENEKRDGAEAVVNRRIPVLAAAGMMGQAIIARDPSEKKKLDLRLKMARLKESVVREATMREAAMHDREEVWALEAIISCLAENRVGDARSTVLERLAHLRRRIAEHVDYKNRDLDSESSDDEPAPSGGKPVAPDPPVSAPPVTEFKLLDAQPTRAEYWIGLSTVAPAPTAVVGETHTPGLQPLDQMKEHLCERGFFIGATLASAEVMHAIHRRTQDVVAAGWPPAFVFMYNEPWQVVKAMWPTAAALLGGEVVLEPSFAAFLLNHRKMVAGERYTCRSNVQRTL